MIHTIRGRIHSHGEVASGRSQSTGQDWKRGEVVIDTDARYEREKYIPVKLWGVSLVDKVEALPVGTPVEVQFHIEGRGWSDPQTGKVRWFVDLNAFEVEPLDATATQGPGNNATAPEPEIVSGKDDEHDLPL